MAKQISAQPEFNILVANLEGGGDPSQGTTGNPVKIRTGFTRQLFPERGAGSQEPRALSLKTPGLGTKQGLVEYTTAGIPVPCSATVTVSSSVFTDPAILYVGDYTVTSGEDFAVAGTAYVGEDITNTPPNGALVVFSTAGPNLINVPANLPITPGSVTIRWTSGAGRTQLDDGAGGFTGDGVPGSSTIDYVTGAITVDTTGLPPAGGTFILVNYTALTAGDTALLLAAAITALPSFTATALAAVVTVVGPAGPSGNNLLLEGYYTGVVTNYTFNPTNGFFGSAEPTIGPPTILT